LLGNFIQFFVILPVFKKILLLFLLSPYLGAICLAQPTVAPADEEEGEEEEKWEEPSCVFSGMMWDGSSFEGLGYFSEGDEKGNFIKVFLPNGGRSRKYAYYGESPITFYREVEVEEDEKKDPKPGKPAPPEKEKKEKEKKIEHVAVVGAKFTQSWKEVFFFFATATNEAGASSWFVKELDFSPESFPAGKFWFISSCPEPITLEFGALGGQGLSKGQEIKLDAKLDKFGDLTVLIFQQRSGLKRKVYSTIWTLNPRVRTLVFLQPRPNGVKVRRISDLVLEEQALGLRPA